MEALNSSSLPRKQQITRLEITIKKLEMRLEKLRTRLGQLRREERWSND